MIQIGDTQSTNIDQSILPPNFDAWKYPRNHGRIVFLGGIPKDSSYFEVFGFLSQFGVVKWLRADFDMEKQSMKGFGYCLFLMDDSRDMLMSRSTWCLRPHYMIGVKIWKNTEKYIAEKDEELLRKIFVKRLNPKTTESDLVHYFKIFGPVETADIRKNHLDQTSRMIGFVLFRSIESAEKCLKQTKHYVGDRLIAVRKCMGFNSKKNPTYIKNCQENGENEPSRIGEEDSIASRSMAPSQLEPQYFSIDRLMRYQNTPQDNTININHVVPHNTQYDGDFTGGRCIKETQLDSKAGQFISFTNLSNQKCGENEEKGDLLNESMDSAESNTDQECRKEIIVKYFVFPGFL